MIMVMTSGMSVPVPAQEVPTIIVKSSRPEEEVSLLWYVSIL